MNIFRVTVTFEIKGTYDGNKERTRQLNIFGNNWTYLRNNDAIIIEIARNRDLNDRNRFKKDTGIEETKVTKVTKITIRM